MNTNRQHGQALVSGLLVLFLSALFSWFIIQNGKAMFSTVTRRIENRQIAFRGCQSKAHILNQISFTNIAILASLSQAANAFAEAAQWNIEAAAARPWWIKEDNTEEIDRDIKIFDALGKRAAASLNTARFLTRKNIQLAAELAITSHDILGILRPESAQKSMCRAIVFAGVAPKKFGVLSIRNPISSASPTLEWKQCKLTSYLGTALDISNELSLWTADESNFGILVVQSQSELARFRNWMQTCAQANTNESIEIIHPIMNKLNRECNYNNDSPCIELGTSAFLRAHWTTARNLNREQEVNQ